MTISIPDGFWDKYYEFIDFLIDDNHIGKECTVVYPPKKEPCINCIKPIGANTTSVYRHGGPMPFSFGECPLCGGAGYKEVEVTDTVRLRLYWGRADWRVIAGSIVVDDADVMVIGYMKDANKVRQATHLILVNENDFLDYRASVVSQLIPWGFGKNRYFVTFLKGV